MRPSYRPHCASSPSVCPSVCPIRAGNSKTKKLIKIEIGVNVLQGTSKWTANYQLKRSKVKVTGRQKSQKIACISYMFTYGRRILLSMPETLGIWTDGRISCRPSAHISFLVISVICKFNDSFILSFL